MQNNILINIIQVLRNKPIVYRFVSLWSKSKTIIRLFSLVYITRHCMYNYHCLGFSFGGLLALSLYSSVWNQTCLSINNLLQNTACITFGLPVVQLEAVDKTVESSPEMRENSHIFHVQGDLIPRLLRFDDISGNGVKDHNRVKGICYTKIILYYSYLAKLVQ